MSNTFSDLSKDVHISHLQSGCEKQMSVILLALTFSKDLTSLRPFFTLRIESERSLEDIAIKSFLRL
jgi:hypothetical protein